MIRSEAALVERIIRTHIEARLSAAPRRDDPVPQIIVNDSLHPDFFVTMSTGRLSRRCVPSPITLATNARGASTTVRLKGNDEKV
jgi:hypothetical protein